jgi:hypothetical protein
MVSLCYRLCLIREQERYAKSSNGHISRVKTYGKSSTTTLREHLIVEHKVEDLQEKSNKKSIQSKLVFKQKLINFEPFNTEYELNRDLAVWACLDLEPFMFTEKPGMRLFFEKNYPSVALPSRHTLSRGALYDVYDAVTCKIKGALADVRRCGGAICIMMDGWTDKYKRYPYLGLRVSFVDKNWNYRIVTLSLKVLERHTADRMSSHIREELKAFGVELQSFLVFTTHDGASNMVKASQLLRSVHFQHCVAHALHLLLVTDGINKVPELVELLDRCKTAVVKLNAKCYIVENEQAKSKDREVMDQLMEKIAEVNRVLDVDQAIALGLPESAHDVELSTDGSLESLSGSGTNHSDVLGLGHRNHSTLKQSCITRWNSVLTMIDSILSLWIEMNEALKANGDRDYCLIEDDRLILCDLRKCLQPFAELTELVSSEQPHLGLIPLIITEVKDASQHIVGESECVASLKTLIQQRLPFRIKMSDAVRIATLVDPSLKHTMTADMETEDIKHLLIEHTKQAISRMEAAKRFTQSSISPMSGSNNTSSTGATASNPYDVDNAQSSNSLDLPCQPSKKMKLLQKANHTVAAGGQGGDVNFKIEREVNTYVHLEISDNEENPLDFWKKQEGNYPNLSVLAKCYLSISASSVPVEAMFSTCGLILNSKRSSMAPHRANMVSVIHDNYSKFYPTSRNAAADMSAEECAD